MPIDKLIQGEQGEIIRRYSNSSEFYVSPEGDDSNSGHHSFEPFATTQHALDQLTNGDHVHFLKGTHTDGILAADNVTLSGIGPSGSASGTRIGTLTSTGAGPKIEGLGFTTLLDVTNNGTIGAHLRHCAIQALNISGSQFSEMNENIVYGATNISGGGTRIIRGGRFEGALNVSIDNSGVAAQIDSTEHGGDINLTGSGSIVGLNGVRALAQGLAINIGPGVTYALNNTYGFTINADPLSVNVVDFLVSFGGLDVYSAQKAVTSYFERISANGIENNGPTTFGHIELGDIPSNSAINQLHVDKASVVEISQTTPGVFLTIDPPTDTDNTHIIYVSNAGTEAFNIEGGTIAPGGASPFIWFNGSWTQVSANASGGIVFCDGVDPNTSGTVFSENYNLFPADATLAGKGGVTYIAEDQSSWVYDGSEYVIVDHLQKTKVKNNTGSLVAAGSVVYISGASGGVPEISLADNTAEVGSSKTFGIVQRDIPVNETGWAVTSGLMDNIDLTGYTSGSGLWLGTSGGYTSTAPVTPAHAVFLGHVIDGGSNGRLKVSIQNGFELGELHDVLDDDVANPRIDGDTITWDSSSGFYVRGRQSTTSVTPQYYDGLSWEAARADNIEFSATSILLSSGKRVSLGRVYWPAHGLTIGAQYRLSPTGGYTETKSTTGSHTDQSLFTVIDENTIFVDVGLPVYVDGAYDATGITPQYWDGSNWVGAIANSKNRACIAVKIGTGNLRLTNGKIRFRNNHGIAIGSTLYLSQTNAGQVVFSPPLSGVSQKIGSVEDARTVLIDVREYSNSGPGWRDIGSVREVFGSTAYNTVINHTFVVPFNSTPTIVFSDAMLSSSLRSYRIMSRSPTGFTAECYFTADLTPASGQLSFIAIGN